MRRVYPWNDWLGKPRTVILRGVHYRCSQSSMQTQIRNAASRRGVKVRLIDTNTEFIIETNAKSIVETDTEFIVEVKDEQDKRSDHNKREDIRNVRGSVLATRSTATGT